MVASNLEPTPPKVWLLQTWRQHLPTTILPQSWLTGLAASNLAPTPPNNDFTPILADRWLLQTWSQHLPTTTLPQSWLTGLVASNSAATPTTTLPQSWLTGLAASNLAPTPPNNDFTPILADRWLLQTWSQHLPTTTLPQSWLTGLVASNLAPTPPYLHKRLCKPLAVCVLSFVLAPKFSPSRTNAHKTAFV